MNNDGRIGHHAVLVRNPSMVLAKCNVAMPKRDFGHAALVVAGSRPRVVDIGRSRSVRYLSETPGGIRSSAHGAALRIDDRFAGRLRGPSTVRRTRGGYPASDGDECAAFERA